MMSIHRTINYAGMLVVVVFSILAMNTGMADASASRELFTSFGGVEAPGGIAVDLETGNVYVTDKQTQAIDVFGPNGGPPTGGVSSRITNLALPGAKDAEPSGVAVDNSCTNMNRG